MRYRVCLVGDFSSGYDEGFKNAAKYLRRQLEANGHDVLTLDVKAGLMSLLVRSFRLPRPDVIHALAAPTVASFLILAMLKMRWHGISTIMSAMHPSSLGLMQRSWIRPLLSRLKPNVVVTQSPTMERFFSGLGMSVEIIPNGVDTSRFVPTDAKQRRQLRASYGIRDDDFVVLHVGHLSHRRNLKALLPLQGEGCQIVIAGSTYVEDDVELGNQLESAGCIVLRGYVEGIEKLYSLADCYVFPLAQGKSLFMPLSVLEAMSADIPVLTTPYEGFLHFFPESNGFRYLREDATDLGEAVARLQADLKERAGTRVMVEPCDWSVVLERLIQVYVNATDADRGRV